MLKTRYCRSALASFLLTTLGALPGCAPDDQASDFVVTSDLARGRLATIEYANGDRVIFSGSGEDGVSIAAIYQTVSGSPLDGIDTERLAPSEVFTYLTGLHAPEALLTAERAAEISSDSDALAGLPGSEVGATAQALTAEEFRPLCDGEFCSTNVTEERFVPSGVRVRKVRVIADVVRGNLFLEVDCFPSFYEHYDPVVAGETLDVTHRTGGWIRRDCSVHTDKSRRVPAPSLLYHLSVDFDRNR